MGDFFRYDNKLMLVLEKIVSVFYVSILWMFACIPVFTIGAATTAMYYTVNKVLRHDRGYIWREFWGAFRSNFKQSTVIWLITMAFSALMCLDTYIMWNYAQAGAAYGNLYVIFVIALVVTVMWAIYVFPYVARFANTTKEIMKNAMLIAVANLPKTLAMFAILVIGVFLVYLFGILIFVIPSLCCWMINCILEGIFRKYMTEEEKIEEDERNGEYHSDYK